MTTDSTTAPGTDSSNTSTETDSGTETDSDSDSETDTDAISCEVDPDATPQCGDGLVAPGEFCPGEVLSAHSSASRRRLSAADINADGAVDILVASEFEIRAFYNDGSSALHGYATDVSLGTVGIGRVIATGDFNGDGALDVTVARADQSLQVYRGNSFGAMTSLPPIVVGYNVFSVAVGDFNEDGVDDVVAGGNLWYGVLNGNLSGPFMITGDNVIDAVIAGDINGDARVDLVYAYQNKIVVYLKKALGPGFEDPVEVLDATKVRDLELADVDGDDALDLIAAMPTTQSIAVLLGDGLGDFIYSPQLVHAASIAPTDVEVLDYNGDGRADIAFTSDAANVNTVHLLIGEDTPSLFAAGPSVSLPESANVASADFNGDGMDDLLASVRKVPGAVRVYWGNAELAMEFTSIINSGAPSGLAVGDINADGNPDFFAACSVGPCSSVYLGNSQGWLETPDFDTSNSGITDLVARDFNADGHLDFAVAQEGGIGLFLGNGVGGTAPEVFYASEGMTPHAIEAADFNADGVDDLVLSTAERRVEVFAGFGDGQFASAGVPLTLNGAPKKTKDLTIGDFNGDAKPDVFEVSEESTQSRLYRGLGGYNLQEGLIALTVPATRVNSGDLNGDGLLDLILAMPTADRVTVKYGNGDGTFMDEIIYTHCARPYGVATFDLDADGDLDVASACADQFTHGTIVLLNDGEGTLTLEHTESYGGSTLEADIVVADMNNDCAPDLVMSPYDTLSVGVLVADP